MAFLESLVGRRSTISPPPNCTPSPYPVFFFLLPNYTYFRISELGERERGRDNLTMAAAGADAIKQPQSSVRVKHWTDRQGSAGNHSSPRRHWRPGQVCVGPGALWFLKARKCARRRNILASSQCHSSSSCLACSLEALSSKLTGFRFRGSTGNMHGNHKRT